MRCSLRTIAIVIGLGTISFGMIGRGMVCLGALASLAACAREPAPKVASGPRIVSLSPAITRTIEALGAGQGIVGCTPWCGLKGVPVVGSLEDRNTEAIAALRPVLVVRQGDQPDPVLDATIGAGGGRCMGWRLNSVADVERLVRELGTALDDAGMSGCGAGAVRVLAAHRGAVSTPVRTTLPVLFLYATDPPAAFGAGTYLDDLWKSMGGTNAIAHAGYPSLTAEDVLRMRPRAVAVVAGASPGELPAWLARVRGVHVVVAPELLEPSARMLVEGPESLRRLDAAIAGEAAP